MMKTIFLLSILLLAFIPAEAQKRAAVVNVEKLDCKPVFSAAVIRQALRGKTLKDVASEDYEDSTWVFEKDELIEIDIVETKWTKTKAVSVVDVKTAARAGLISKSGDEFNDVQTLQGRIRLNFELVAGRWELLKIENISAKLIPVEVEVVEN